MIELNKRVILKEFKGVVKYYGEVEGTTGVWVGVDWDNKERGKHDGSYKGKQYFKALSNTSGSFVREKDLDFGSDLFDEINEKYASNSKMDEIKIRDSSNAKLFEFVKMDKIYSKQKQIFQLKCIVLSFSKVSHLDLNKLGQLKFNLCSELDLCSTLIGKWNDLINILSAFPVLKTLRLDCNRIEPLEECTKEEIQKIDENLHVFKGITQLSLNECNLTLKTLNKLPRLFISLEELYLAKNNLDTFNLKGEDFKNLILLDLQGNPFKEIERLESLFKLPRQWESIDQLGQLPSLEKLNVRGTFLSGSRGVESREMIIAKLPKIIYLDKCDISSSSRQSAELLFLSRFSSPPICLEHKSNIERLKLIYGFSNETEGDGNLSSVSNGQYSGIQSRRLFLSFEEQSTMRPLSLALPLHKVVGLGARLFGFEPDQLKGVEIQRSDPNYPSELVARTKDNLLRQFELEDGDTIRFV
uniref:Tubulin-specific chaperone E n=1 Tax=Meloidogyne hapla TaxID=6305 RepID=A0A1I8B8E8_MELHA